MLPDTKTCIYIIEWIQTYCVFGLWGPQKLNIKSVPGLGITTRPMLIVYFLYSKIAKSIMKNIAFNKLATYDLHVNLRNTNLIRKRITFLDSLKILLSLFKKPYLRNILCQNKNLNKYFC